MPIKNEMESGHFMTTEELFLGNILELQTYLRSSQNVEFGRLLEFNEVRETVGSVASDLCFEFNMQRPESLLQIQVYSDIRYLFISVRFKLTRYLRRLFASLELHVVFTTGVQLPTVEPSVGWNSPNAMR